MRARITQSMPWVVLFMLAVTAGVAIWAVFSEQMDEIKAKILITSGTISGACILILPCLAHVERKYLGQAAWTGVVLIAGTAILTLVTVWGELESEVVGKTMATAWIVSTAVFAAFVTLLAKLAKSWIWVHGVTVLLIATLAAELVYSVWVPVRWGEEIVATNAILMTLGIISAWVLHVSQWLASRRPQPGQVMCPRCGKLRDQQPGDMQCIHCSTVFTVKT